MFTTVYHWHYSKPDEYPCNILPQPFSFLSCINMLFPYQYYKHIVKTHFLAVLTCYSHINTINT